MARVEKTIEVDVPVRTAYNQWTQFESFPQFMDGVEEVHQLDDRRLHWKARVAGKTEEWEAVIREQVPDEKIIWQNTTGATNAGMVKFDQLGPTRTRVHLEMSYDPEGFVENVGDALGFVTRRVEGDLQRFKDFIESRGVESGAWRGEIQNEKVPGGHTRGSLDAGEGREASPGGTDDRTRFERATPGGSASPGGSSSAGGSANLGATGGERSGYSPTGGDIASGSSAMQGTSTGTAYDSSTGSGYTAQGMTGSSGGSMQGGGNTSYGNAGAGSSTGAGDYGYANDPQRQGLTGSAYEGSHSHHFAGQEGESPSTPTTGGSGEHVRPGGIGGEYPEEGADGAMRSREERGGMGGEYPERGAR